MSQFSGFEKRIKNRKTLFRPISTSILSRWVFIVVFMFLVLSGNATVYYVSNSGDDSNPGTSENQPWKTLNKVNYFYRLKPGDQVLFKRGDKWTGTLRINTSGTVASPIVYGAYGSGEKPKIYGSEVITGWTEHSGNIWKAKVSGDINQLFIDGKRVQNARYPKKGYLYLDRVNSTTSVTCNELIGDIDFSGAKMHTRTVQWRLITSDVISSLSSTLRVRSAPSYGFSRNSAFFLNNHLIFLNQPGEWYFDKATKTVYFWTPEGDTPENYIVRGSLFDNCIFLDGKTHITINDLSLLQSKGDALHSNEVNFLTINNLSVNNPGWIGLYVTNSKNLKVINNYIRGAMSDGMYLSNERLDWAGETVEVVNNEICDVGLFDEIGPQGIGLCNGIFVRIKNAVVKFNRILNNGYNGIQFYGKNTRVQNNFIDGYCETLNDGGGIYTWVGISGGFPMPVNSSGSEILSNIIINGNEDGTGYTRIYDGNSGVSGIYADLASTGILIEGNTVLRSNGWGILLNKVVDVYSRNNILFDNPKGFRYTADALIADKIKFEKNIIYHINETKDWDSPPIMIALSTSGITKTFLDSNLYVNRKYSELFSNLNDFSKMDFFRWKIFSGIDYHSSFISSPLAENESEKLFFNDTKQPVILDFGTEVFKDIYGKDITGKIKLEPFTSVILIGKNFSEINKNPVILDQSFNFKSPVYLNDSIGKVFAHEPDSGQQLNYSIIHGEESSRFTIDSVSGVIYSSEQFQTENDLSFQFQVKVTDNASNLLADTATVVVNIAGKEIIPPSVSNFEIPDLAFGFSVPVHSFVATGDAEISGYQITETLTIPPDTSGGWTSSPPGEYLIATAGTHILYAWAIDTFGNVSSPVNDTVTVVIPDYSPTFSEYLFEEDTGNQIFDSQGLNDGIIVNDISRVNGAKGSGLMFTGLGYLNIGQCFDINVRDEISLSVWLKPDEDSFGEKGIVMHGGPDSVTFGLFLNSIYKTIDFITSGTTAPSLKIENAGSLWDGNWHHLMAIYNGEEKIIYLDNEVIATIPATGAIDVGFGYNLIIGAGTDEQIPINLYKGLLDEVRIWNFGISAYEVDQLFHSVNRELNQIYTAENISICEGEDYLGWTQPGQYERVLQRVSPFTSGADSIVTTNLQVNPGYFVQKDVKIIKGENYKGWSEPGTYEMNFTSVTGCDSILVINLIVEEAITQLVELNEGWNIFSSYLIPVKNDLGDLMSNLQLENKLIMVRDESDLAYEEGNAPGKWINNIGELQKTEGYKILVSSASTLEIKGTELDFPLEIELKKGLNIIAFPFSQSIDAMQIFQPLVDQGILEKVQDESGNSIEYWNTIGWVNGIGNLNAGDGYLVHVYNAGTLIIEGVSEKSNPIFSMKSEPNHFKVDFKGNGYAHMNINITGLKGSGLMAGDEIAVFDDQKCVGAIRLNDWHFEINAVSIPSSSSDKIKDVGFTEGNPVNFLVWRARNNETVKFTPGILEGELKFSKYSSVFVSFNQFSSLSENIRIFPNPVEHVVYVEIPILPKEGAEILLLDASGKELFRKNVYSNLEKINVKNLPSGLYFLKAFVHDKILTNKIIVT